jgi:hypothetical protein
MKSRNSKPADVVSKWYGKLLVAVALFGMAVAIYQWLSMWERDGGRVNWFIAVLYYIGGKFTACALPVLGGIVLTFLGIRQLVQETKRK